jgi:Spy/CpxP family protein refolding chaperone
MNRVGKILLLLFFLTISPQVGAAQGPPERKGWEDRGGRGMMGPPHTPMMDWASQLNLTPEQSAKLQDLREAFLRDTLTWRNELLIKRFDLRDLLRNPDSEPQVILSKQREISDLESKIQERGILLQIELRKVLTPEQIKLLPPHAGGMYGPPMMPGRGRGMGREY